MSTRSHSNSTSGKATGPKPPPNYFSRGVQMRLMMMVATLMLVLVLMFEARKPENWLWMGFEQKPEDGEVDTRFGPQNGDGAQPISRPDGEQAAARILAGANPPGGVGQDDDGASAEQDNAIERIDEQSGTANADPSGSSVENERLLSLARLDFWRSFYGNLEPENRALLFSAVRHGRHATSIESEKSEDLESLVRSIAESREAYHMNLLRSIANLPLEDEAKRELWNKALLGLQTGWAELQPALDSLIASASEDDAPEREKVQQAFVDLQAILDAVSMELIEDDAVASRLNEREAWYRMFERVEASAIAHQPADASEDAASPTGEEPATEVSFLQLFKQPDSFRGRRVKIDGYVHRVERKRAAPNDLGIEQYHLFWIRPKGRSNAPIAVYARHLPEGFPEYDDKGMVEFPDGPAQPVAVDGLFFKRWGYQAQDGVRLCPLIIASRPTWTPASSEPAARFEMPALPVTVAVLAIIGCIATGIAWWAYRVSNRPQYRGFQVGGGETPRLSDQLVSELAEMPEESVKFSNAQESNETPS